jgi:hypothetical protein
MDSLVQLQSYAQSHPQHNIQQWILVQAAAAAVVMTAVAVKQLVVAG